MTVLSINVNKIALLRNSRGSNFPDLTEFVKQLIDMGVKGITVHPRPDQRHITRQDVYDLSLLLQAHEDVEFNIEGYPGPDFLDMVCQVKPDQCTLVPDSPEQLTSDHGWDLQQHGKQLETLLSQLRGEGIRSSLFLDPSLSQVELLANIGTDRIELYTEEYAASFGSVREQRVFDQYLTAAKRATELGVGINAGHDLNLKNLPRFLSIPGVLEVSIGHALVVESIHTGLNKVVQGYLDIVAESM